MIMDTIDYIWNIYQEYDYMGMKITVGDIEFYDNGIRELGIRNTETGRNIESISMAVIEETRFKKLAYWIVAHQPKTFTEYADADKSYKDNVVFDADNYYGLKG